MICINFNLVILIEATDLAIKVLGVICYLIFFNIHVCMVLILMICSGEKRLRIEVRL